MKEIDCITCQNSLEELLLEPDTADMTLQLHLARCVSCATELQQLRSTLAMMDEWTAPEPSPFFDTRLYARMREEPATARQGVWAHVAEFFHFQAGRGMRTAMAGALGLAVLLGGGTAVTLLSHHTATPVVSSPTVNDLKIYDNNAQTLQEMDLLDEGGGAPAQGQS